MPATPSQVEKLRNHSAPGSGLAVHLGDVPVHRRVVAEKRFAQLVFGDGAVRAGPLELGEFVNHRGQFGLVARAGPGG